MITDLALLPIKEKAEAGNPEAQRQMALAYVRKKGVVDTNDRELLRYFKMLANQPPSEIPLIGYGTLLVHIGDILMEQGEYFEATEWYRRWHECDQNLNSYGHLILTVIT